MKLWAKSILGLLSTGAVAGAALGGMYAYSLSDKSKGDKQYSARGLINNINDFKKVDAYNINFVSSINPNTVLGKYDYKTDTVDGKPTQQWVKNIIAGGKQIPILHVNAGPVRFENFYPEAIFPKDFVNFVEWFSSDVSWGADISSLSYFRIKRGIEYGESGSTVTLGNYAADHQSSKRMQFIPDSFYGESDVSVATLQMFPRPVSRTIIETLVELINEQNKSLAGSPEKMLKIYSIEKKGDDLYLPIISSADDLIFKWEKGNPTMLKEVSNDIDVETDLKTGQSKLVNRPGKHLPSDSKIPNLAIFRTMAGSKWKGLNFHWLKYVTQHEYGHMQTMGMVSDSATSPIPLGPSPNNMPNSAVAQAIYDLDEINRYLQARLPQLKAIRASVNLTSNGGQSNWDFYDDHLNDPVPPNPKHFNNIAWEIKASSASDWTKETIEDIFGSSADITDPNKAPYRIDASEFIENIKNGENPRFFTKSLKDQRALAQHLGIPVAGTYLMNAFDNMMATTSSGFSSGPSSDPSNVKSLKFLDSSEQDISERKWVSPAKAIANMKSYDGGLLFKKVTSNDDFLLKVNDEGQDHYFDVSDTATDKEGNNISQDQDKKAELKIWIDSVLANQWKRSINGREKLSPNPQKNLNQIPSIDQKQMLEEEAKKPDSLLSQWFSNPNIGIPGDLKGLFADYTYLFSEVLTRDWVQMTYRQENSDNFIGEDSWFRYQSNIAPVQEINTGIERYLDPSIFLSNETKAFFDTSTNSSGNTPVQERRSVWLNGLIEKGINKGQSDAGFDKKWNELLGAATDFKLKKYNQVRQLYYGIKEIIDPILRWPSWLEYTNHWYNGGTDDNGNNWTHLSLKNLLTKPSITNNGYNVDRWLRAALAPTRAEEGTDASWALYNDDGSPAKDPAITIKDFATGDNEGDWQVAADKVRAFWSFFMQSRGVGLRTISKIWRVPDRDAFALWGYVRNEWEDKLKHLTFTNSSTGKKKSFPVTIGGSNLFYYKHQGGGEKHTLNDDGYTSWTVDFLSLGTWFDSNIPNGDWIMSFTDKNGKELKQTTTQVNGKSVGTGHVAQDGDATAIPLFDLGNKEIITENGFDEGYAPVIIEKNGNRAVMHIKNQFPI